MYEKESYQLVRTERKAHPLFTILIMYMRNS